MSDTGAWQAAGLYDPDAPGAADRRALLEHLVGEGATVADMVEANRAGRLPALAGHLAMHASVMGYQNRQPAADETRRMQRLLDQALDVHRNQCFRQWQRRPLESSD